MTCNARGTTFYPWTDVQCVTYYTTFRVWTEWGDDE